MECILVTGSAGFVGGHVLTHLTRDLGLNAIGTTRDGRPGSRRLDLRDPAGMQAALAGVSAVVHCAVGDRAVTVDGTAALLRAAVQAGVSRVVHVSSIAVYGAATGQVREDTPMVPPDGQGYAAWKAAAEQVCLAETRVQTVRLRPTIVYGPGSTLWAGQMARRIRSGRWGVAGAAGDGTCNPVHVSDVATAIAVALATPGAAGQAFNINGPETLTWNDWFTRLGQAIGAPRLPTVSPATFRARAYAALGLKAMARIWPRVGRDWLLGAPARSELALFSLRASYPTDAARRVLDWTPTITIADGLIDTAAWLRSQGLAV
jgi:nucleoside-diphosphate-sugar epimerase